MSHLRCALVLMGAVALAGCEREARHFEPIAGKAATSPALRMSEIQPNATATQPTIAARDEVNAFALAEGKRLYGWYNCSGCHANGGGDKGPALMDDVWIYGADPENIYATIVEGRPNGMPSFGGHIPDNEVWEIVAYVRSMSGLASNNAAPGRADAMQAKPAENLADPSHPVNVRPSSASGHP